MNVYEVKVLDDNDYSVTTNQSGNYQLSPLSANTYSVEGEFNITAAGNVTFTQDVFNLNADTTAFTLSSTPISNSVRLFINGLLQKKTSFSVTGMTLNVLDFVPTNLDEVLIEYNV